MARSPMNLAMLRIILAQTLLGDGAHLVAVAPDGTEHPIVGTSHGPEFGREVFRFHLGTHPSSPGGSPWNQIT